MNNVLFPVSVVQIVTFLETKIVAMDLTNRRQFSMVYTLIDHKMKSKNVQNSSGTTSRRRVVSLPSFGHFMASFYGL